MSRSHIVTDFPAPVAPNRTACCGVAGSSFKRTALRNFQRDQGLSVTGSLDVRMLSLPSLLREVGGPAADLLKLDVEGEEVRVLESAGAAIGPHSAVCVAVHSPAHYRACAALLRSRGMRIAHSGPIEAWRSSGRWRGDPDLVGIGPAHPLFCSDLAALDLHPVAGD